MPSIQSHEVSLGYAQFVARNSSEAFEFICEDSKKALRDSFLNQIVPMNLDAETPIPYKGEVLGINAGDINRCRRGWFEREFAKLNAPTMQQLVHKFGNSVVASYYLPPESDETKAIVYRTLGSLDFQADSALLSRLISLQYLDEKQVAAVEFVKKQHAEIHTKTESLFSDIVVEDRRQRAAVEESYGLIFANHRCLEREAEIEHEGRLRPILVLFEQSKGLVRSLEELATAAQSKYDGVSSALPRLQSRAKDLSVEIQRLNRELKSNITHSAQVQIAEIDKQLARFPSGTVSVADRIQFLKLELEHMQKKEQLVRYNITDIASKRAQLEKNRSAMGDDADATLDSLETRRKEAAKVTGVGNAVKALMPGSQYNEEMNSIIHKIQLKNEQLKIEGDIAVLEAQPKLSAEDRQQKTTYENELRDLQDQEAKMVEKVGLQNKKAAQEKIIAEYQSLPVIINVRVYELNRVESQITTSSLQLREMAQRLNEAKNNELNAKDQHLQNEAMLKEAKEAYKRKATELHLKRKELEKNQEKEFSQLKEKKAQMIDQVNKQCAMEIQAVSDAFNARYKA
jgi:hypothetical protein